MGDIYKVTVIAYRKPLKKRSKTERVKNWKKEGEYTYIGNVEKFYERFINSEALKYNFTQAEYHLPSPRERHLLKRNNPLLINSI